MLWGKWESEVKSLGGTGGTILRMKGSIAAKLAVLGIAVTGGLLAYSLSSFGTVLNPLLVFCLCPPAILLMAFMTFRPQPYSS
jgi:type IV secretory pathway VirB2 component (pilin)